MLVNIFRGEIEITEGEVNQYLKKSLSGEDALNNFNLSFHEGTVHLKAGVRPVKALPYAEIEVDLVMDSLEFQPGSHLFRFALLNKPTVRFQSQMNKILLTLVSTIIERLIDEEEILQKIFQRSDFIDWCDNKITINLDLCPEFQQLLDTRVPLTGARVFDYVGISEVLFKEGSATIKPVLLTGEILDKFKSLSLFDGGESSCPGRLGKYFHKMRKVFNRILLRVEKDPERMHRFVDNRLLQKVKQVSGKIGNKVMEAICYLWEAMQDPQVPLQAKLTAITALLYFISPIDAIPDFLPFGFMDDGAVLTAAIWAVGTILTSHGIKPDKQRSLD